MKNLREHFISCASQFRDCWHRDNSLDTDQIIAEFCEAGFNVTEEAILHNFNAWCSDFKSGFRDEANGYFLYTPCGHNALRFEAIELKDGLDWQHTYLA